MKYMKAALNLLLAAASICMGSMSMAQPIPTVASGTLERLENFASQFVAPRHVDVWLPEGYRKGVRHNVLYMHDGQMLFDAQTTWNHQAWNVDATVTRLMHQGKIPPTIVVGIWNTGDRRYSEYFPEKQLAYMTLDRRTALVEKFMNGQPLADRYLRFMVQELKPVIDGRYTTYTDAAHTFVMGSSMGGLISVYAMNEYPQVFGGAAGLSTHWIGSHQPNAAIPLAAFDYLRDHLASPQEHRLYQDHGTSDLDALYAPYQVFIDQLVRDQGYTDVNYQSRVFENAGHNEKAWASRLELPLVFLMGTPKIEASAKPVKAAP
jgi:enterochelin esterase-like enzyme